MRVVEYIIERRKETVEKYHKLIHPKPIIADIRKNLKIGSTLEGRRLKIITKSLGDLLEMTLRDLRTVETWSSILSTAISNNVIRPVIEDILEEFLPRRLEKRD